MDIFYFINQEKTKAIMLNGRTVTKVVFSRFRVGDAIDWDIKVQTSAASAEDVMRIRRDYTLSTKEEFNTCLANVVGFGAILLKDGTCNDISSGQIVVSGFGENQVSVDLKFETNAAS